RFRPLSFLAAHVALLAEVLETPAQERDAAARAAAVRFELRLTGPACSDPGAERAHAAAEAFEVLPQTAHARQVVLELRELDLQLAFGAARVLREDVEDQLGAVDNSRLQGILE